MEYQKYKNNLIIEATPEFDVYDICHCGQLFRYFENKSNVQIIAKDKVAFVLPEKSGEIQIQCNDECFFENYFDLKTDYTKLQQQMPHYDFLQQAMDYGKGIRILNQDFFETFFSFMVSQNNNIKRIQNSLNLLAKDFGEKVQDGFAFPKKEVLLDLDEKYFQKIGLGYRARYFPKFLRKFDEIQEQKILAMDTENARSELMNYLGVGRKVADCILLFGLHRKNVFPVDTWIDKVAKEEFGFEKMSREKMSQELVKLFGDLSGYAQQYLFYFKRENAITKKEGKL